MDLEKIKSRNRELATEVRSIVIVDSLSYHQGAEFRAIVKERLKKLEEARKLMASPFLKKQREINDLFKEQTDPLTTLVVRLDIEMLEYKKREQEKILEESSQMKEKTFMPVSAPERTTRTKTGVTSLKKMWKGEVVDRALVWRKFPDFFIIDQRKVDEMARFIQKEGEVDGVRIFFEEILASRT